VLKQQGEQDRTVRELLVGLQKVLSYAKVCCELKGIDSVPNVIKEVGHAVVDGVLLIDEYMRSRFIGQS
jgi:hypothetical protein